jgi:hypothetical protein
MSDRTNIDAILNPGMPRLTAVSAPKTAVGGGSGGPGAKTKVESRSLRKCAGTLETMAGEIGVRQPIPEAVDTKNAFRGWQFVAPLDEARWRDQTFRLRTDLLEISDGLDAIADRYDANETRIQDHFAGGRVI